MTSSVMSNTESLTVVKNSLTLNRKFYTLHIYYDIFIFNSRNFSKHYLKNVSFILQSVLSDGAYHTNTYSILHMSYCSIKLEGFSALFYYWL